MPSPKNTGNQHARVQLGPQNHAYTQGSHGGRDFSYNLYHGRICVIRSVRFACGFCFINRIVYEKDALETARCVCACVGVVFMASHELLADTYTMIGR